MPDNSDAIAEPVPGTATPWESGRFCPTCGARNESDSRYCKGCGRGLATVPPPPVGQPAPVPPYYMPPGQRQSTNGFAIASMVLGIVWIYWIGSILALVFGYMARKQIGQSEGREGGGGMATAGIVLGWIGIATLVAVIVIGVIAAATSHPNNGYYGG